MQRRNFIAALIALPGLGVLAACGSGSSGDSLQTSDTVAEEPVDSATPPASTPADPPPEPEVSVAPLSGDLVLSYTTPGGFTTREFAFQDPPAVMLTQDGALLTGALVPAVFPGPLLPQHMVQSVTPEGIQSILAAAESAGLFADIDYATEDELLIADAPTTVLTISAADATYTHEAYALGIGGGPGEGTESTPERQALLDFLTALTNDPASLTGADGLGEPSPYTPTAYQLMAVPVEDLSGFDPEPTVEGWPADAGVELATATDCVEVDREAIGDLLETATQLTFFTENDVTYQVTARPAYPGRSC